MDTSLISVILPAYNGSRYIREAIESVLAQDYKNFELIIIDDASIDDTSVILEKYAQEDARIRIFRNEKNMKLVASLNRGLELAKGEYIARIDDDDIWSDSSKLAQQIEILEMNLDIAIVGTFAEIIDEDGVKTGKKIIHSTLSDAVSTGFRLRNQLVHTSILARTAVLISLDGFRSDWLYVEDYDLWLRVLEQGYRIINIPQCMVSYRVRSSSTTGKKYHRMQWLTFLRLYRENSLYKHCGEKCIFLCIRIILILTPLWIIRYLKE